jgi:RNA polymerase sigma-70 factor (ECF subfamily)
MPLRFFTSNPSDSKLIECIRHGGQEREWAAGKLLNQHIFYVKKLAKQFSQPEESVLDAYTDALMLLLDHVAQGRFRGESKLSTYLYQILFNKCRDLLKKPSTNTVELTEWTEGWDNQSRSLLKDFIEKEDVANLHRYLDQIGETCKQVLLDWGYWGYSMEEIAERTGMADGEQAKKRKYKCLQKLREIMTNDK